MTSRRPTVTEYFHINFTCQGFIGFARLTHHKALSITLSQSSEALFIAILPEKLRDNIDGVP